MSNIDLSSAAFQKTLKECSCDKRQSGDKEYMTDSELQAIDFDTVKEHYAESISVNKSIVRSVDTILRKSDSNTSYFIEFKNGVLVRNSKTRDSIVDDDNKVSKLNGIQYCIG